VAGASLVAQPAGKVGKHSNWRNSQAFSGEFDATRENETRPGTGSTAHFARFRTSAGRKPRETLRVSREGEGIKSLIALFNV
jgi:hypothetical protein